MQSLGSCHCRRWKRVIVTYLHQHWPPGVWGAIWMPPQGSPRIQKGKYNYQNPLLVLLSKPDVISNHYFYLSGVLGSPAEASMELPSLPPPSKARASHSHSLQRHDPGDHVTTLTPPYNYLHSSKLQEFGNHFIRIFETEHTARASTAKPKISQHGLGPPQKQIRMSKFLSYVNVLKSCCLHRDSLTALELGNIPGISGATIKRLQRFGHRRSCQCGIG